MSFVLSLGTDPIILTSVFRLRNINSTCHWFDRDEFWFRTIKATLKVGSMTVGTTFPRKILNNGKEPCEPLMTHILRKRQSKLTSIYKLRFGKASQKCLQICSFNYYYRTTCKKVSTYSKWKSGSMSQWLIVPPQKPMFIHHELVVFATRAR